MVDAIKTEQDEPPPALGSRLNERAALPSRFVPQHLRYPQGFRTAKSMLSERPGLPPPARRQRAMP